MNQPLARDQMVPLGSRTQGWSNWPILGSLAIGTVLIALVFLRDIQAAIEVWSASTAYSHCYLVLPMTLYLLWERRPVLAASIAEPDLRFAVAAAPLTALWLIAERLGIMEARQLIVVAGFQVLCLTILGRRLYGLMAGPLLFLFFLVPFGAFLTPALQQFTASFTILGLDLLGIPNFSDGFTIETPAGVFFVAEACAGLRFLIAAIAFGVFYSLLSYTSILRRAGFIAASIVVPIIANGLRALGIVVLGQILGSAEAAATDHIVYGWVFFSAVMLLLIAGGHAFRDATPTAVELRSSRPTVARWAPSACAASVVSMLALGPALAGIIDLRSTRLTLPETVMIVAPPGCSMTDQRSGSRPDQRLSTVLCGGVSFEVSVTSFGSRSTSSAMISEQRRVTQEIGAENASVSRVDTPEGAGRWTVVQTTDPDRVTAYAGWVDGVPVASGLAGRIAQARDSLFGSAYAPALITITAAEPANSPIARRNRTLDTLSRLLSAQSSLDARMATLTRLPSS